VTKVKEDRKPKPPAPVASVPKEAPSAPIKKEAVSPKGKQTPDAKVKEGIVTEKPVSKKAPAAPEKEKTVSLPQKQASKPQVKEGSVTEKPVVEAKVVTAETDPSLTQEPEAKSRGADDENTQSIEKEKELLASKGETLAQQDREERLKSFLRIYCRTYESKDIDKFAAFFTPDAVENNTSFQDMLPKYRKNMEKIESFSYRIELAAYSLQTDTGNVKIQGDYFTRYLLHKGTWQENSGSISMELTENGDSFLVKRLNYSSR